MLTLRAEFHLHTVLSACAGLEMLPPLIVAEALYRGIQVIAVTDHNATGNIQAVQKAAAGSELIVLPGMEVQTREEVHVICLFDQLSQAELWQNTVDSSLPELENQPDYFGEQLLVDENGDFVGCEKRLLLTSTNLSINQVFREVESIGGLAIPAHVNRPANGLLTTLGFVPPELPFSALEISRQIEASAAHKSFPQLAGYTLLQGGDAHRLEDIRGLNQLQVEKVTIAELRLAFNNTTGRSSKILSPAIA